MFAPHRPGPISFLRLIPTVRLLGLVVVLAVMGFSIGAVAHDHEDSSDHGCVLCHWGTGGAWLDSGAPRITLDGTSSPVAPTVPPALIALSVPENPTRAPPASIPVL